LRANVGNFQHFLFKDDLALFCDYLPNYNTPYFSS
jgi:hypothetical protein